MKEVVELMQAQFNKMCATGKLFKSNISGDSLWKTYLKNFKFVSILYLFIFGPIGYDIVAIIQYLRWWYYNFSKSSK